MDYWIATKAHLKHLNLIRFNSVRFHTVLMGRKRVHKVLGKGKTVVVLNATISPDSMDWLDVQIEKKLFATRSHGVERCIQIAKEYFKEHKL